MPEEEITTIEPILLGQRETARVLGVCVRTIDNFIANKQLPVRKIGDRTLIPSSAIVEFANHDQATAPINRNFKELQAEMSPEAQARSKIKANFEEIRS